MVNLFGYPSCSHRSIHLFCDTQAIKFMGLLKKIGLDIEVSSLHQICVHTRRCIELLLRCLHSFLPTNESDFCQFKCLCEVSCSFIFLISFTHKSNCLFDPGFTGQNSSKRYTQVAVFCINWFVFSLSYFGRMATCFSFECSRCICCFLRVESEKHWLCLVQTSLKSNMLDILEAKTGKRENHVKMEPLRGRGHLAANHCYQIHLKSM